MYLTLASLLYMLGLFVPTENVAVPLTGLGPSCAIPIVTPGTPKPPTPSRALGQWD